MVDNELLFDFLDGVDVEFDQIRVQVLDWDMFPTLEQTYCSKMKVEGILYFTRLHKIGLLVAMSCKKRLFKSKTSNNHFAMTIMENQAH